MSTQRQHLGPSLLIHATLPILLLQILPLTISIGHMDTYYLTPH